MTIEQVADLVQLGALAVALISLTLAIHHVWAMLNHMRPSRTPTASLLGVLGTLFGALYDDQGQRHRESFAKWVAIALAAVVVGLAARFYLEGGANV